jgi:hypothetical protein
MRESAAARTSSTESSNLSNLHGSTWRQQKIPPPPRKSADNSQSSPFEATTTAFKRLVEGSKKKPRIKNSSSQGKFVRRIETILALDMPKDLPRIKQLHSQRKS